MAGNPKAFSELPVAANVAATDRVVILRDPSGNASLTTTELSTLSANLVLRNTTPATSSSNGVAGFIAFDSNYVYVCVANNTWKRAALTTW